MTTILHLSDLHFSQKKTATVWSSQLTEHLKINLKCNNIDLLIISGDIGTKSTQSEYLEAEKFIEEIRSELKISASNIILTPGNHDLNWPISKKAYSKTIYWDDYKGPMDDNGKPDSECSILLGEHILLKNDKIYQNRFRYFTEFYKNVTGSPYPKEKKHQGIVSEFRHPSYLFKSSLHFLAVKIWTQLWCWRIQAASTMH